MLNLQRIITDTICVLGKINSCHNSSDGRFCSGSSGGVDINSINEKWPDSVGLKIPGDWKTFDAVAPDWGGKFPKPQVRMCHKNAVCNLKIDSDMRVIAGVAFGKESLNPDKINIYPLPHVWNLDKQGRVVDTTYGHKWALNTVYIGTDITGNKGLISTQRRENKKRYPKTDPVLDYVFAQLKDEFVRHKKGK